MRLVRLYPVDLFLGDAVRVVDEAPRIRQGEHLAAKLDDLFRRVGRDIARAGDHRGLADQILLLRRQHVGQEINGAIAGRLGADQRPAHSRPLPVSTPVNSPVIRLYWPNIRSEEHTSELQSLMRIS